MTFWNRFNFGIDFTINETLQNFNKIKHLICMLYYIFSKLSDFFFFL